MNGDTKTWFSVTVNAEPEAAEAIEFALNELGALGTAIDHLRRSTADTIAVEGFFNEPPDEDSMRALLFEALRIFGLTDAAVRSVQTAEVEQTDWLAEWKKHWRPTEIGSFIIAPPWEELAKTEKFVIRIEPNMAFGTGTHETTQLCVAAIESKYRPEQTFLDVGTGTGILAIAAAKMGGTSIDAYDTDADSVKIARENAKLNGVAENIRYFDGSIGDSIDQFDLVCANLTLDVILPILPLLIEKTRETLILSGILTGQEPIIDEALAGHSFDITHKGEWIALTVELR